MNATQSAEVSAQAVAAMAANGPSSFDIVAIGALVLNAVALLFAGYQTLLTRKSLTSTDRALELSLRATQVEVLPEAGWVIQVQVDFDRWIEDLEWAKRTSREAREALDSKKLKAVANRGLTSPKGLVRRYPYEQMPEWLGTIWMAGAQYYYDATAPQRELWNHREDSPWFDFVDDMADRFDRSLWGIRELQQIIHDMVPSAYLEAPASLSDDRFLD